jgi:hypothetical protein
VTGAFDFHPEPELIGHTDEATSRAALEALGRAVWDEALRYLFGEATARPVRAMSYEDARRRFYGPTFEPAGVPAEPSTSGEVLAEFRERVAPYVFNAQHPGSFSYFTAPPLPMSVAGEVLAQWVQQSVDVWAAGPVGAFVEEEVTAWLRALVGYGEGSWGVLTSGGVMANIMALTIARDIHLRTLLGASEVPRGAALERARVYASDQAHFSIERAIGVLGFPPETLRIVPSDDRFRLHAAPVAEAIAEDRASGLVPFAIAAVAGSTNTGSVDRWGAGRPGQREGCGSTSTPRTAVGQRSPEHRATSRPRTGRQRHDRPTDGSSSPTTSRARREAPGVLRQTFHRPDCRHPGRGRAAQLVRILDRAPDGSVR